MILVEKPDAPEELSKGDLLTQGYRHAFELNPDAYKTGEEKLEIEEGIYKHKSVKNVLREAHHRKCCFCESLLEANAAADIEHYRPKAHSQQGHRTPKIFPGYYWLAYSWGNLFYCCQVCNRSYKRNFFPLRDQNNRARSHLENLAIEEPLILNPSGPEDPRDHIHFRGEVAGGITDTGEITIKFVGLNRSLLYEERLRRLQELQRLRDIIQVFFNHPEEDAHELVRDARNELHTACQPAAEFSAMASDFINDVGIPE